MKRIINITLFFYLVIFVYNKYSKQDRLVLTFSNQINGNYVYNYHDTRITDIKNDILRNVQINNKNIQFLLVKASEIYLDLNDLVINDDYNAIVENMTDLDELLSLMRKYSKEKIIIKLLEEKNDKNIYINKKVKLTSQKYDIIIMR
jgi:hypothetical protein